MIKSAIATAVVAATTATAIADTELYGRFRAGVVCTDNGDSNCGLENRSSRFGIKASEQISDGLTAFGKYEFGVDLDKGRVGNADKVTNRLSYVGIKGGFGEVSIGTRWSPMYNYITSPVDPYQLLGGTWADNGYAGAFRRTDTVNYKNKFGPASMHVQVQMDDAVTANDVDEFQIGGQFKAGNFDLGLAYQDTTDVASIIGVHGGTKFGPIGVGLSYYNVDSDTVGSDSDHVLGLLSYGMGGGKSINLSYGVDMPDTGSSDPSTIAAEYEHKLSKNYRWFAAIQNQDLDSSADDVLKYGVGMRLEF